jgi:hypothetical protein
VHPPTHACGAWVRPISGGDHLRGGRQDGGHNRRRWERDDNRPKDVDGRAAATKVGQDLMEVGDDDTGYIVAGEGEKYNLGGSAGGLWGAFLQRGLRVCGAGSSLATWS